MNKRAHKDSPSVNKCHFNRVIPVMSLSIQRIKMRSSTKEDFVWYGTFYFFIFLLLKKINKIYTSIKPDIILILKKYDFLIPKRENSRKTTTLFVFLVLKQEQEKWSNKRASRSLHILEKLSGRRWQMIIRLATFPIAYS